MMEWSGIRVSRHFVEDVLPTRTYLEKIPHRLREANETMEVRYHPSSDMLNIRLADKVSVESEEVYEGFVFDFDREDRVVSIEVSGASQRVNLELIRRDPASVVEEISYDDEVFTASEMAERIGVSKRGLDQVIQNMRGSGQAVGLRPDVAIYTEQDEANIRIWRQEHRRGRPRKTTQA